MNDAYFKQLINDGEKIPPYVEGIIQNIKLKYTVGDVVKEFPTIPQSAVKWLLHLNIVEEKRRVFRTVYVRCR